MTDETDHLETEFIFIDTEAYVREKFDWKSKSFGRIHELTKAKQLRVLTTSITKREVRRKLSEALTHAQSALKKYEVIIEQLGISTDNAGGTANERLLALFDEFLKRIKIEEIPLTSNLEQLFDNYFQRFPPFSDGKKSEFPDAAVVDSLKTFANEKRQKIYVVSGDPDLKDCCVEGSGLIHAPSLNEIISRATVTKKLHDDLLNSADCDSFLKHEVRQQLRSAHVYLYGLGRYADHLEVEASVEGVEDVKITMLNVISREANRKFVCELEFEVYLFLALRIATMSGDEIESEWAWAYPTAEVTFEYDADADDFSYLSVSVTDSIEVEGSNLDALRKFR